MMKLNHQLNDAYNTKQILKCSINLLILECDSNQLKTRRYVILNPAYWITIQNFAIFIVTLQKRDVVSNFPFPHKFSILPIFLFYYHTKINSFQ